MSSTNLLNKEISVLVVGRRDLIKGSIVELKFAPVDPESFQLWEPGAHIEIVLPSGLIRPYSLCGDPFDDFYTIAVLREPNSRGGGIEIHEQLELGSRVILRGPKNHFLLTPGNPTVFIAGGIGITPLLPMMRQLSREKRPWILHYGGKSLAALAYLDALQLMDGNEINIYLKNEARRIPVPQILSELSKEAIVYVCGPESMISEVEEASAERGIPVRLERFGPAPKRRDEENENSEFEVTLVKSGKTLRVPANERLIDVVRSVIPTVPFSCEEGFCGSCETGVLEGVPDHRDSILTADEKAENNCMMICVGRSKSEKLLLDL